MTWVNGPPHPAEDGCVVCDQYRRDHPTSFTPERKHAVRRVAVGIAGIVTGLLLIGGCWYIASGIVDLVQWIGH